MVRELYIDDQRVDLPDDVKFQLTFQIADFGDLSPRGSGSNTIKLPKTPRNVGIFERCNFVQVASNFPYALHSAYYYEDGFLVFNDATVYMLAITESNFEIQCVWGNATEIRRLKALDMGNVAGLGNVNYGAAAYAAVETGMREYQGELQRFPLSTRYSSPNVLVYSEYTRGVLPLSHALGRIGFSVDNMSPAIKDYVEGLYVFPAVKSVKKAYKNVRFVYPRRTTEVSQPDPNDGRRGTYSGGLFGWGEGPLNVGAYDRRHSFVFTPNENNYTYIKSGDAGVMTPNMTPGKWYDVSLEVTVSHVMVSSAESTSFDFVRSEWRMVAVFGQVIADYTVWPTQDNTPGVPPVNDSTLVLTGNVPENPASPVVLSGKKRILCNTKEVLGYIGDEKHIPPMYLTIYPSPKSTFNQGLCAVVTAEARLTVSAVGGDIEDDIQMPVERDGNRSSMVIEFKDVLRGISAYDFLTQSIVNAGAVFDAKDGQTRVFTYEDIVSNGSEMLDWSDRLVYIKEENTFNQSGGSRNWVKYKQTEYYNGYGDGFYEDDLAKKLEKSDKTLIENSVFGFVNDGGSSKDGLEAYLPFVLEKEGQDGAKEYEYKESGMHLVRLFESTVPHKMVDGAGYHLPGDFNLLASWNGYGNYQPTFGNIEATNWSAYVAMQQAYRKAKAIFRLSPRDVAELDFKRPIYLRQYAQAYVVTKVNYQPHASTVEMVLIR